jgi:MarR family 2-MHQ and catechol resistance regulon transcriptional repressor
VRRRLSADLEREGLSATGFSVLVILTTAGGELELRVLRARLRTSKANATEVVTTLESRGLVHRRRLASDRRAASVAITDGGAEIVDRLFPEHSERVAQAFAVLDEAEKRSLASICRKLAA